MNHFDFLPLILRYQFIFQAAINNFQDITFLGLKQHGKHHNYI
jgi:hypothetical protein